MTPGHGISIFISVVLALTVVLCVIVVSVASLSSQSYPPMRAGDISGSISGRVITNQSAGINNSYVAIVNAANTEILYAYGYTDTGGYYRFSSVNSTRGGTAYKVYAKSGDNSAYSTAFAVDSGNNSDIQPLVLIPPTPTPTPLPGPVADVDGYITEAGSNTKIDGVYVMIVDATNNTVYEITKTGNNGYYRFFSVSKSPASGYRLHFGRDGYDEVYSPPFVIDSPDLYRYNVSLYRIQVSPTPVVNETNVTPNPTAQPSPTAKPGTGLPALPGFEPVTAIASMSVVALMLIYTRQKQL